MAESVCFGEVFTFAPPVAAQMTLDKTLLPMEERELNFLRRRLHHSFALNHSRNLPVNQFVVVNTHMDASSTELTSQELGISAMELQSRSDPSLTIAPPPPIMGSPKLVLKRVKQCVESMNRLPTAAKDYFNLNTSNPALPLETISETDTEHPSSARAGDRQGDRGRLRERKQGAGQRREEQGAGQRREELSVMEYSMRILAERSDDSSLDSRQTQVFPYEPRVLITSNATPVSSQQGVKTRPHPARYPSVVSLTFPTEKEPTPPDQTRRNSSTRKPKKTPARLKRKRNERPQTVPAMKIKSCTL